MVDPLAREGKPVTWRKAADNDEYVALTDDAGLFITGKKDEMEQLLEYLLQVARKAAIADAVRPLLGGWREVIAEIDDLPKHEALGKAMWACLDQIDDIKQSYRQVAP